MTQVAQRKQRQPIARMNGLWTPQSAAITDSDYVSAFTPQYSPRQRLTILVASINEIVIATHLPTPEGWNAELA